MPDRTDTPLLSDEQESFNEHTALPWRAHDMEHRAIVKKDHRGDGTTIIETAPATNDHRADIEAEATRDFILEAVRKYYPGERLRKAAAAFWSDTDTRTGDEKHSALLAAIVEYDNNQL